MDENNTKTTENVAKTHEKGEKTYTIVCPTCRSEELLIAGRCITCICCGWSACSI